MLLFRIHLEGGNAVPGAAESSESADQYEIAGDESCRRSAKAGRREIFVFFHCFFAHDNIVSSSQEL